MDSQNDTAKIAPSGIAMIRATGVNYVADTACR